jgi:hypothetical protein
LAIVQSNYIPWKGYFDLIAAVDEFILLDDVQYTSRDWRNRNLIKTPQGPRWLSVPVRHQRHSRILDVTVATDQGDWARKHLGAIEHAYAAAPLFRGQQAWLASTYAAAAETSQLSAVNRIFIEAVCRRLGIATRLSWSADYLSLAALDDLGATQRLVALCRAAGASFYLSGPAAKSYLDVASFEAAGIEVAWMDYAEYREYPQLHGPFDHAVSVLDLLLMTGPAAPSYLKYATGSPGERASDPGRGAAMRVAEV